MIKPIKKQRILPSMKTSIVLLIATVFCLFIAASGNAMVVEEELQIDFSFDTQAIPDKDVISYRLYEEDIIVCESNEGQTESFLCDVTIETGNCEFTLSAVYDDGTESPHSAPFPFTITGPGDINGDGLIDLKDIIISLQVLINLNPQGTTTQGDVNGDGKIGFEEVLYCLNEAT